MRRLQNRAGILPAFVGVWMAALALIGCAAGGEGGGGADGGEPRMGAAAPAEAGSSTAGAAPSGEGSQQPEGAPRKARIAFAGPATSVVPLWVAESAGIFERHGLDVEVFTTDGGSRGLQVLLSGEIDAMHVGLGPVALARGGGAEVRMAISSANTIPFVIYARPEIGEPADLRGKSIGVSTLKSESDIAVSLALEQWGLSRSDVTVLQIGGSGQRLAALEANSVQAVPLVSPVSVKAESLGYKPLINLLEQRIPWVFDGLVFREESFAKDPGLVKAIVSAYIEGAYYAMSHPDETKQVIGRWFKTEDPASLDATFAEFQGLFVPDGRPSEEGAENLMRQLTLMGENVKGVEVGDLMNTEPLDALEGEGFFRKLRETYGVTSQ